MIKPCPSSERSRRLTYPESSPSRRRSSRTEAPSAPISHNNRASPGGWFRPRKWSFNTPTRSVMVRLKLRTCSTSGISMKTSRLAQSINSQYLIIVREHGLAQEIEEAGRGSVLLFCWEDFFECWFLCFLTLYAQKHILGERICCQKRGSHGDQRSVLKHSATYRKGKGNYGSIHISRGGVFAEPTPWQTGNCQ